MLMKKFTFLLLFFVAVSYLLEAKPPELEPQDVNKKMNEILSAHVTYKELSPELMQRIINNFIEDLDPGKVYFTYEDIQDYQNYSEEELLILLKEYKSNQFDLFFEIHDIFVHTIDRRKDLEVVEDTSFLEQDVNIKEFYKMDWAQDTGELQTRLQKILAVLHQTSEKLEPDLKEKFAKLVEKRRKHREEDFNPQLETDKEKFVYSQILKASASALDSQTHYFTPEEANSFMSQVQQKLYGIGALLRDDLTGFMVLKVIEGGPSSVNNGLKVKDRIIAVDHEPVVGMDISDAVALMRGKEGTSVVLTVLRDPEDLKEGEEVEPLKLDVEIIRGEVVVEETRIESTTYPFGDGVIAHLTLHSFYQDPQHSSASDLYEKLAEIKRNDKVKGVILDLRGNTGGFITQAVAVTGLFINKGIVVSIRNNDGSIQHLRNIEPHKAWDGPLVVLINKGSASASEIVAGTLQDYGRAVIVGDSRTFGKGTFQTFTLDATTNQINADPKGEFKVTRGMYYTVSGKSPQLVGVQSDIQVPGIYSELEIGEMYSKYPVPNDHISENYNDDLSDIPPKHRAKVRKFYKYNLQPKLNTYAKLLPQLQKNTNERIEQNQNYQNFLVELKSEDKDKEVIEVYGQNDLQLEETINIMKDLILLAS